MRLYMMIERSNGRTSSYRTHEDFDESTPAGMLFKDSDLTSLTLSYSDDMKVHYCRESPYG